MFQGVLVSASQVVALEDPAVSAAVYIALLLFSPVAACTALAGAFLGSMAGASRQVYQPKETLWRQF